MKIVFIYKNIVFIKCKYILRKYLVRLYEILKIYRYRKTFLLDNYLLVTVFTEPKNFLYFTIHLFHLYTDTPWRHENVR